MGDQFVMMGIFRGARILIFCTDAMADNKYFCQVATAGIDWRKWHAGVLGFIQKIADEELYELCKAMIDCEDDLFFRCRYGIKRRLQN